MMKGKTSDERAPLLEDTDDDITQNGQVHSPKSDEKRDIRLGLSAPKDR